MVVEIEKKIRDLAVISTITDSTAVELDDGVSGIGYQGTIAQLKTVFGSSTVEEKNIIYVGKHGDNGNNGKNISQAKLTFGAARAAATAGDVIVCLDAGTYTENYVSIADINVYAPNATLDGQLLINHSGRYVWGSLTGIIGDASVEISAVSPIYVDLYVANATAPAGESVYNILSNANVRLWNQESQVTNGKIMVVVGSGTLQANFIRWELVGSLNLLDLGSGAVASITGTELIAPSGTLVQSFSADIGDISCSRINVATLSNILTTSSISIVCPTIVGTPPETGSGRVRIISDVQTESKSITSRDLLQQFTDAPAGSNIFKQRLSAGTRFVPAQIAADSIIGSRQVEAYLEAPFLPNYYKYGELTFRTNTSDETTGKVVLNISKLTAPSTIAEKNVLTAEADGTATIMESGDDVSIAGITVTEPTNLTFNSTNKTITGSFNTTLTAVHSSGVRTGGVISDAGSATIDVSGGTGYFRATDSDESALKELTWSEIKATPIPTDTIRYVGVDYNAGSPAIVLKTSDTWTYRTDFRLGSVVNEGGTLHILNNPTKARNGLAYVTERLYDTLPFQRAERVGGLIIGETGTRNVTLSAGDLFDALNRFSIPAIDTSVSGSFDSYLGNVLSSAGQTQWDNDNYNNGGVLTPLIVGRYANLWWYIESEGHLVMLYGEGQYTTVSAAESEPPPPTVPLRIISHGRLVGRFIFIKGGSTAELIQSVFDTSFAAGTVSNHAALANLNYSASNHPNGYDGFQQGTTLSTSDPTINDDETKNYVKGDRWFNTSNNGLFNLNDESTGAAVWKKTYSENITSNFIVNGFQFPTTDGTVNQVMYTDGAGNLAFKTEAGSGGLDQLRTFYVSKAGSDSNNGKQIGQPFLTIGKALTEAALLTPSSSAPVNIYVIDGAIYSENIEVPEWVRLIAAHAQLTGQCTYNANTIIHFDKIINATGHCYTGGLTIGGGVTLTANYLEVSASTTFALNHILDVGLSYNIGSIYVGGTAAGGINQLYNAWGNAGVIYLDSNALTCPAMKYGAPVGRSTFNVDSIRDSGGANPIGIWIDAGNLAVRAGDILVSGHSAIRQGGGTLFLHANALEGVQDRTSGTLRWLVEDRTRGALLNSQLFERRTYKSGAVVPAPLDDTPPLVTEGLGALGINYTAGNTDIVLLRLTISAQMTHARTGGSRCYAAIYHDTDTTPLKAAMVYSVEENREARPSCVVEILLPGRTSHYFELRAGTNNTTTVYLNGNSTGRIYGGSLSCDILVEEFDTVWTF